MHNRSNDVFMNMMAPTIILYRFICKQVQNTICEHRDDGRAGGVFRSYEIVKVSVMEGSSSLRTISVLLLAGINFSDFENC